MKKIVSIHYLRGIAALLVVAYHNKTSGYEGLSKENYFEYLFKGGAFGVDLFFIISGFIIAYSTQKSNKHNLIDFAIKRTFRIYPIFLIALSLYIIINPVYAPMEILKSYFFINRDYDKAAPFFGYNVIFPAWSLSYEIYFYFIFSLAMSINHRHRILLSSIILVTFPVMAQLYFNGNISLNGNMKLENTNFNPINFFASPMMFEFVTGMILFCLHNSLGSMRFYKTASSLLFSLFLLCYFTTFHFSAGLVGFGTWSILLVTAALILEKNDGMKSNKILHFFGDISYSLYLVHAIVMLLFIRYNNYFPFYENNSPIKFMSILSASIFFAWIMHKLIERPMLRLGRLTLRKVLDY